MSFDASLSVASRNRGVPGRRSFIDHQASALHNRAKAAMVGNHPAEPLGRPLGGRGGTSAMEIWRAATPGLVGA